MGLQTAMVGSLMSFKRSIRLLFRKILLLIRLCFPFIRNYNHREVHSGIPQPAFYNSWKDVSVERTAKGLAWVNDLRPHLHKDQDFLRYMGEHRYDEIVQAYFPTKVSPLESVNLKRTWLNSYWNPANHYNPEASLFNSCDILFADMMSNSQNIYKFKRVLPASPILHKVHIFFGGQILRNKHRLGISAADPIELLVSRGDLYCVDYEALRTIEKNQQLRKQIGGKKYVNEITTIIGNKIEAFIEIPFAIYAYLPNPAAENKPQLLCLGAVFNDTFFKKSGGEVSEDEIFTPFYSDERGRDRWEMAKIHMASCDNNDFTIRTHLGILHYASSIYTCALSNIARDRAELRWLKDDFVDVFSRGLLQIDFNANLTLIDHVDPMAEKIFYLRRTQSAEIILLSNLQFNILDFCPEQLEKDCFISDSVMISSNYYQKLKLYIDFLICKNWESISDPSKIYRQLLAETADDLGKLDGLPASIVEDGSPTTLRKILTNLAYLWVVFHAQTFSLVSVASPFYYVPSIVRKPLSALSQLRRPLSDDEKMEWLPNTDIIRDNMTLHKVVTFRMVEDSLISRWSQLNIDEETWGRYLIQWKRNLLEQEEEFVPRRFFDFWNDLAIRINNLNSQRLNQGLYVLHWFQPNEMPICLNI